ncbi:MAG: YifB family Mg chelatase-like AAA ATPase [Clostridia bacterium]|nr:YifB family Mg chelatase-like AAA ATPase [Clostridia bacterium]
MSRKQKVIRLYSGFADGVIGIKSEIEISHTSGLPNLDIIGLCDSSIRESRGRIKAALIASGYEMPRGQITVNITPAYMHKSGSAFDLAIAIGLLMVSNQISCKDGLEIYAEGELALDGKVKGTPGSAIRLSSICDNNQNLLVLFPSDEIDSAKCNTINGHAVTCLKEAIYILNSSLESNSYTINDTNSENIYESSGIDLSLLKGQEKTQRALLIAASGWHNLLLIGSPGAGKTLAGRILLSLLPPLTKEEIREVYSIINLCESPQTPLTATRPFRYIHQSITPNRLICSGSNLKPGEIILANRGILFADELCEFNTKILDLLREPMENRTLSMSKDGKTHVFSSNFIFIGATNPCKCGMYMEPGKKCSCSPSLRHRYLNKLSGPFLDRIDIFSELHMIDENALKESISSDNLSLSNEYREKVKDVWNICRERHKGHKEFFNSTVKEENLAELFRADKETIECAANLARINGYSARGINKLLRVGRTIADLNGDTDLDKSHLMEAQIFKNRMIKSTLN